MAVHTGRLAGLAGAHANIIAKSDFPQETGLCSKYTHKQHGLTDIVQRLLILNYVFAILLLPMRNCHLYQQQPSCERNVCRGFIVNPWSQHVIYAKILNNGRATQPTIWTNSRRAENLKQPHRKMIYLMADLLLAGDIQPNLGLIWSPLVIHCLL